MNEKINQQVIGNMNKTLTIAECFVDRFWDMWHLSMGSLTWSNEQMEQITKRSMEQRRAATEEGSRVLEQIVKKVQTDQNSMQKMVRETMKCTIENTNNPVYSYLADMNRKISDLSSNNANVE
jgi:polyhydroxyalkanoate synthesis regulator phasin